MDWKLARRKLIWKLLTLGILVGCLWLFTRPQPAKAAELCEACSEDYYWTINHCYGDSWLSVEICILEAADARDACVGTCTFEGDPEGGGGGGRRTRTACEIACHSSRLACVANGGNPEDPDVQDCLDGGGSVTWCCIQEYSACMDGCAQ